MRKIQAEYSALLHENAHIFHGGQIETITFCRFLDQLSRFWLGKLEMMDYWLKKQSSSGGVVILSGAMYLAVDGNEHFYFKCFGKTHIIHDPFQKLEIFARTNPDRYLTAETGRIAKKAFYDTLYVLDSLNCEVIVLPVDMLVSYRNENLVKESESLVWSIVSNLFKMDLNSNQQFVDSFKTIAEIEKAIPANLQKNIIFSDQGPQKGTLREKVLSYQQYSQELGEAFNGIPESEVFILGLYSQLMQVTHIMLTGAVLEAGIPIRFEVTMHWLLFLKQLFSTHEEYGVLIKDSILFYLFRTSIPEHVFQGVDFHKYCVCIRSFPFESKIRELTMPLIDAGQKGCFSEVDRIINVVFNEFMEKYVAGLANVSSNENN